MTQSKALTLVASAVAVAALSPESSLAGGISLYEIATPDVGLASAGYAARADDASTVFKNPAGMSRLQDAQLQSGFQLLYADVTFDKDSGTGPLLANDGNGGNAVGALPGASLFVVVPMGEKFAFGFGSFSYFGLALDYDNDWAGRYYVQNAALLGMSLMPSVSYKATDWLSVGAGLNAMYGYMETKAAVRTGSPDDGRLKIQDEDWGFGGNFGIMITPNEKTRFGVTYLSAVCLDFSDAPSFSNLGPLGTLPALQNPSSLDLGITVPQMVMVSVYHKFNDKWGVMANVGWQDWSEFGKVDVSVDSDTNPSLVTDLNYKDTWHGALGAEYYATEKWTLTGGFAYDTSAVSDGNRTVTLPMGEAYRFGVGALFRKSDKFEFGAGFEFIWAGDMKVSQESAYRGDISGSYENAYFTFFTLNTTWHF